jgi:competence protein ComEC
MDLSSRIDRLRDTVRREIDRALSGHPARQVISALVVGDQRAISPSDWAVFQKTGVAHLMSISGLHVTMFAALAGLLGGLIWRLLCRWPFTLAIWIPVQSAAAITATLGAFGYALMAGFAVPAQRTAWMVAVFALSRLLGLRASHWSVLSLALLVIVVPDPMAVLAPGFWLSFLAVGFLFSLTEQEPVSVRGPTRKPWQRVWPAVRVAAFSQLAITFGLLPITAYLFQQIVLVSLPANALAIPVVSYLVTPLAMLGTVEWFLFQSDVCLAMAASVQHGLHGLLVWMSQQSFAAIDWPSPGLIPTIVAALGMLLVFGRFPAVQWLHRIRHLGWFGLLFLASGFPHAIAPGEMKVTVMDVGQGSGLLIRTQHHTLLYDTGPSFGASDAGARAVLPTLRRFAVREIDRVVLSHLDQDHAGGLVTIVALGMVKTLHTPDPSAAEQLLQEKAVTLMPSIGYCRAGDQWVWDGVRFQVLHPAALSGNSNADSCLLRVEDARGNSLLLTGDITPRVEKTIVGRFTQLFDPEDPGAMHLSGARLASQVVMAPHHGSRHALTEGFLRAVSPAVIVIQAGARNHFGHPHPETIGRIESTLGGTIKVLRTDLQGAIDLSWNEGGLVVRDFWGSYRRYWHRPREDF